MYSSIEWELNGSCWLEGCWNAHYDIMNWNARTLSVSMGKFHILIWNGFNYIKFTKRKKVIIYIYKKIIYPQGRASWNETEAFINPVNPKLKLRPLNKMDYSEHFAATVQTGHGTCNLIAPFSCEAHGCWVNGQVMYRLWLPCSKFNSPNGPVIITLNTDCLTLNYLSETH